MFRAADDVRRRFAGSGWRLVAAALVIAAAAPAGAGQATGRVDLSTGLAGLPSSAESGKPILGGPPPGQEDATGCAPALPCGTRLYGAIRKNGAIELQVPALHW
jgi:hypothetical protein